MILAIIQARLGSTRLPNKVLMDLNGKTILERVIDRMRACTLIDKVMVASAVSKENDKLGSLCGKIGVEIYRGSENDVLDRFYQASKPLNPEHVVRITADCPLLDPKIIDRVIKTHLDTKSDYTSNVLKESFPDGEDVEIFKFSVLEKAWNNAKLGSEREHVTPYIKKNPGLFKLTNVENDVNLGHKRWTVDEPRDYEFVKTIYEALGNKLNFGMEDVLVYLESHPEIEKLNSEISRNEGYVKSIQQDKTIQ